MERISNMKRLLTEIYELEQSYKKTAYIELQQAVVLKRDTFKDLIEEETRQVFNGVVKDRYQCGNKPGKYLARILRNSKVKLKII